MQKKTWAQIKDIYLMPFRAIASGMKLFLRNRNRARDFSKRPEVAKLLKYGLALTMLIWLVIALTHRDQGNNRLEDAVINQWQQPATDDSNGSPAPIPKP